MINNIKLIYLASPYTDKDTKIETKRFKLAAKIAGKAMDKFKVDIYSPIAHGHTIDKAAKLKWTAEQWYNYSFRMLEHCDEIWVLDIPGYPASKGVQRELMLAKEKDMPIYMITPRLKLTKVKDEKVKSN